LSTTSDFSDYDSDYDPDVGAWYAEYSARLRSAVRRITKNESDAEDATQDAFLAAFRARHRYQAELDPYPWLMRIATRKALTIAGTRRPVRFDPALPPTTAPSAEDQAIANAEAYRLRSLVASERAVALHLVDGLRFSEVGAVLAIPAATAATRIRRGKHRLRAALAASSPLPRESKNA